MNDGTTNFKSKEKLTEILYVGDTEYELCLNESFVSWRTPDLVFDPEKEGKCKNCLNSHVFSNFSKS